MREAKFDIVNYWSEVKLDIIREYAQAYSRILDAQTSPRLYHIYIDAFARAGQHISKSTGEFIPGSPLNALLVKPPFKEYHFIDLDGGKANALRNLAADHRNVYVYGGDCNEILHDKVFPHAIYKDYKRALCLLDPYGLHLNWDVIAEAGSMGSVEIFLNFPIMDMNRNVLRRNPENVDANQRYRMDAFWGDDSWRQVAYETGGNLFAYEEKTDNKTLVTAFQKRLKNVAGFKHVPDPIPMRNVNGAEVYYLFFASMKPVAEQIVTDIFNKYHERGAK